MVAIGMLMLLVAVWGLWLLLNNQLTQNRIFLRLCALMLPSGFIAVIAGWFTAEVGRQPYTVYGLLRTVDSVSPVTAESVGMSLIVFIFAYSIVFFAGIFYIGRLVLIGPAEKVEPVSDMESKVSLSDRVAIGGYDRELLGPHLSGGDS